MRNSKTTNAYSLSSIILKPLIKIIVIPVSKIINKCFVQVYFHTNLKFPKLYELSNKATLAHGAFDDIYTISVLF